MDSSKQKIMTINAKSLFKYFPKSKDEDNKAFCFDTRKRTLYTLVVKEEIEMKECPMLHQLLAVLKADEKRKELNQNEENLLYDQFLVMDFDDIFMPIDENSSEAVRKWRETQQDHVKDLMKNGLEVQFKEHRVHMMPFDKSANMSRNGRISFVNNTYVKQLNERLNLGIDFSDIPVKLSKYYAYRGLYLSTSQRVQHKNFKITPETLIIVKDKRKASGNSFQRDVKIETAEQGKVPVDWKFKTPEEKEILTVDTPFDGEGLIVPKYSKYINEALGVKGANSFQIRLPFAKGMLHQVDVLEFVDEFTKLGTDQEKYIYEDAFAIKRDLRKARIFMTESMFKGKDWVWSYCKKNKIDDPMQYYCEMIEKYNHGFYVSGTNLPYGHSKYTHLSYQTINTLAFDDDQFSRIMEENGRFVENPIEFLNSWDEIDCDDIVKEDSDSLYQLPNWKRAVLQNPRLTGDKYIKTQLQNIQKSLLSKIALGKILVEGQTRYLCRDLLPLLSSLLNDDKDVNQAWLRNLYTRFYLPRGKNSNIQLNFEDYYAFFRNPHLSRNEQYIMRAFVLPKSKDTYAADGKKSYEKYVKYVKMYDKYFGHLTGIVMVPRGSTLPLCLGGADFDGDLVSVIFNQDVVDAVKRGVYEEQKSKSLNWWKRVLPAIEIPSMTAEPEYVKEYVEYEHIYNTFSNHIGRISNAAIAIGQIEYARDGQTDKVFDATKPTCAKCTLLTGLEIDAAKNGLHPNLDLILNSGFSQSAYLFFLRQFKKLKSEEKFNYELLKVSTGTESIKGIETEVITITSKGCETEVFWCPESEDSGTYINLLPRYFLKYFEVYKNNKRKDEIFELRQQTKLSNEDKEAVKEFIGLCDDLFEVYGFYKNIFLKELNKEKRKGYYAVENTELLLMRMYDEDQVDEQLYQTIPDIRRKIGDHISSNKIPFNKIRNRINEEQWQFQPLSKRENALERIIGNGFNASMLTENEKNLLFHFHQQGYKLLWRIIDLIEGPRTTSFEKMYDNAKEKRKKDTSEKFSSLEDALNKEMRNFYENNTANVAQKVYEKCLNTLEELINEYTLSVDDITKLVAALYKKTKTKTDNATFFWNVFSWEEMKSIFATEEVDE